MFIVVCFRENIYPLEHCLGFAWGATEVCPVCYLMRLIFPNNFLCNGQNQPDTTQPRPGPNYKVDMFFFIHLKDDELAVCCRSQYQSSSGHNIANVILLDHSR
jgi:hypothetical protein